MHLRRLTLAGFRCYRTLDLTLPCGTVLVVGRNGQGKSSLLEAIYLLATTRSPHAASERELIRWPDPGERLPFSRVRGEVVRAGAADVVEVSGVLQRADEGDVRFVKRVSVNDAPRRAFDVIGMLNVVLFTPRELQIVDGAPTERRRFLDVLRCQVDRAYCMALARYNKVLAQRNHLLRRLRDHGGDRAQLAFWDAELVRDGAVVTERRAATVTALADAAAAIHSELTGDAAPLVIEYRNSLARRGDAAAAGDRAAPDAFAAALAARRDDEIARGMTLVGPHRDDLALSVGGVDLRVYGSRGQQRTAALALKLAEARLMWRETGERPVLLLDDVLSELDIDRRRHLLAHVDAHQQTFITTAEEDRLPRAFVAGAHLLAIADAAVVESRDASAVPPVEGVEPQ